MVPAMLRISVLKKKREKKTDALDIDKAENVREVIHEKEKGAW